MAIRRAACRAILSAALMGLAGCTTAAPRAAPTPTPSTVADCISADEQSADGVGLPADNGRHADGVILGSGETGVVLANQVNDDLCTWKTVLGDELTDRGYRVLLFDWSGGNPGNDVLAGVAALRRVGVQKVFLVGASRGGAAVLYAAANARPPVNGVVSLSGPLSDEEVHPAVAVRSLTVPVIFVAAKDDEDFASQAQSLYTACASTDKKLDIVLGAAHGWDIVDNNVSALIESFVAGH